MDYIYNIINFSSDALDDSIELIKAFQLSEFYDNDTLKNELELTYTLNTQQVSLDNGRVCFILAKGVLSCKCNWCDYKINNFSEFNSHEEDGCFY